MTSIPVDVLLSAILLIVLAAWLIIQIRIIRCKNSRNMLNACIYLEAAVTILEIGLAIVRCTNGESYVLNLLVALVWFAGIVIKALKSNVE